MPDEPITRWAFVRTTAGLGGHWKNRSGGRYWASFPGDNPPPDVQMNRNEVWVKCAELGVNYYDITIPGMTTVDEAENNVRASYERRKKLTQAEREAVRRLADASLLDLPPDYAWIRDPRLA